jgi:hypothetical protein|tara:strand:+ start:8052 stop:8963 length:912 start_codon:yes stop_codon:yes gene_type:complete
LSYALTYYGKEGQSGLYARIKRVADSYWWDNNINAWESAADSDSNISLTETSGTVGEYTGTATSLSPSTGGLYEIYIYDSVGTLIISNTEFYQSDRRTALEVVNAIQQELRFPESTAFTDAHAKLVLRFVNDALSFMLEKGQWDELKVKGSFVLPASTSIININPTNSRGLDAITHLQITTNEPLVLKNDEVFRCHQRTNTSEAQPLIYRHYGRAGSAVILEFSATPDQAYTVDFEGLLRQSLLAAITDVPRIDTDILILGGLYFLKRDQGDDYSDEQAAFLAKVEGHGSGHTNTNFGDLQAG